MIHIRNAPIRRKLMTMMLLTSGVALLLTSAAFLAYEFLTFRQSAVRELSTLGSIIATNSTAALAFDNADDARDVLAALRAEPHVVAATLYDRQGRPFAHYPDSGAIRAPTTPGPDGFRFSGGRLIGFRPVIEGDNRRQGTLYLEADMGALYDRLVLYGIIAVLVFGVSLLVAYLLSRRLQQQISQPILALADVATAVSDRRDYSVRAPPRGEDELGSLTNAFNHMLGEIHQQNEALRASEEALRSSEQSLATTLDSIADAVIATDTSGRVVRMNPVAELLTGWSLAEAEGRPLAEVFRVLNETTRQPVDSPIARILRDGTVVAPANHTALTARDGGERPIASSGAPIRGPQGEVRGVVLVFRDQTEERRTQEMRLKSAQLEAQNLHVHEASRLKSEFLANMSHELRTPLNGIIGFAELMHEGRAGTLSGDQKEHISDILSSGKHLLQLINDVLDLSKVEAGKLEFRPEPLDLTRLIGEVLGVLRTTVASKAIRVESQVDAQLTDVVLDASRLKQVLYNYVSNALKFTPEGGQVMVRARPEPGGAMFRLEVEDTGPGIDPADIGRLFVEFQQLDAGAAKKHGGTGLGLALTKRLVQAQGGTIGVHSTPGQGSTFFAILPRQATSGVPLPPPRDSQGAGPDAPAVLIVEDDMRDQAQLFRTLTAAGFAVETAATGAQALEMCRERTFDAITLDLLLPDMSGLDVLRDIRSAGRNRDATVIVVTMVTEEGAVAGFTVHDVLPKPLDGPALLASLGRAGVSPDRSGAVLVVDDDPASLKLMSATLAQLGYASQGVSSGAEGLRIATAMTPPAIVLDLRMPEMDGFAFLERLRQIPACRHVPVIIWSVLDLTAEQQAHLRQSAQRVLAKGRDGSSSVIEELAQVLPARRATGVVHGG